MHSTRILLVSLLLILLCAGRGAGGERDTDVLVMIAPGQIEFDPALVEIAPENAAVSPGLLPLLESFGAERIIRTAPGFEPSNLTRTAPNGATIKLLDRSRLLRIRFPGGTDLDAVTAALNSSEAVVYAERIPEYRFFVTIPNDTFFTRQWGLHNTGQAGGTPGTDIDAPEAWDMERGSGSVKIGIIDTGTQHGHEDLSGKVSGEASLGGSHGTHVAGIAAAKTDNVIGVAGVSWYSPVHAEDISSFQPSEIYGDIIDAVDAGCFVLNHSWGGSGYSITVRLAFAQAYKMNTVAIVSMGNWDGAIPQYPAAYDHGTIAVGAIRNTGWIALYSDYGDHIDIVAPGGVHPYPNNTPEDIYSTWTTGSPPYRFLAGTSMAAPFVTGVAALIKSHDPTLDNDDVMEIIRMSGTERDGSPKVTWDPYYGHGRVNAARALDLIRQPYSITHQSDGGAFITNTSSLLANFWDVPGLSPGLYPSYRHTVQRDVSFAAEYIDTPEVWGRGVWTVGYSSENPNFGCGWTQPVEGTLTRNGVRLQTYVYEVYNVAGQPCGWYPCEPADVSLAYSVHGIEDRYPPDVEVLHPNGGQSFQSADLVHITWEVSDEDPATTTSRIDLKTPLGDGMYSVENIADDQPVDGDGHGAHDWRIPAGPSRTVSCMIRIKTTDSNGHMGEDESDGTFSVTHIPKSGDEPEIKDVSMQPLPNRLHRPSPNPFNPDTRIEFDTAGSVPVTLKAYDVNGRLVRTFHDAATLPAGRHRIEWNGRNDCGNVLPSGVYFIRMTLPGYTRTVKAILLR